MKSTHYHCSLLIVVYLWVAILFVQYSFSLDYSSHPSVDTPGICVLNFTQNPYQPTGECLKKDQERIMQWDSIRTTLCCRNALTALSQALALRTLMTQPPDTATIFISQPLWRNCTAGPFTRQPSVSADLCGFSGLFYGDSSSHCSNLTLQEVKQAKAYEGAVTACSNTSYGDFNGVCPKCTAALTSLRVEIMARFGKVKNENAETAICTVAAVVSIVAATLASSLRTEDIFQCLLLLDKLDPDYLKIKYALAEVVLAIVIATIAIALIIVLVKYVSKKKKGVKMKLGKSNKEQFPAWSGLYRFSTAEIEKAISCGGNESLGRGSAGHVFKGILPSGQPVAIKHIHQNNDHADSFRREVEGLSRIRHPNLVSLFGFCIQDDCRYLVYEYCAGGNLSHQLLRKDTLLTWDKRVRILRDCAIALRYLHRNIDGCIVHRDIKLTNILLTETLEPKLSDFGLAKLLNMEESRVFTAIRGTIGYMDPEYMSNAKLTCASDIYSFGIVTLQILAGQKVIELNIVASDQLTRKAKDVNLGNRPIEDFEDPRLKGKYNKADFRSILSIAIMCVASSSKDRPDIEMVLHEMNKAWKNTDEFKRMKKTKQGSSSNNASATSPSLEEFRINM